MNFVESGFVDNGFFIRDSDNQGDFRFDGLGKLIFVNSGVSAITIANMYSRWCDWILQDDNMKFKQAMRFSGYDPIPGGFTGTTFFLTNGWKVVYDPNLTGVSGVLYSEDYATAYWNLLGNPVYPAVVSSLVNSSVSYQNVVTGTAVTPEEIWSHTQRTLTTGGSGSVSNVEDIALAVRAELATELARIDAAISTRSTVAQIWSNIERTLTEGGSGGGAVTNPGEIALAVRAELATELARIDKEISSRVGLADTVGANVLYIRGQAISGTGSPDNPWRPA